MNETQHQQEAKIAYPGRILVVDDEQDVKILFRQLFRREIKQGMFKFTYASNGVEALKHLERDPHFDMVLSDIRMPTMDGLALLAEVNVRFPLIRTVMVTAYGDMVNIRRAMNNGAFDFVSKPIQYRDLRVTMVRTLEHVREIRELHQARQDKERAQARLVTELRKLNRLKDDFLANTSHELKTPLIGMIGLLESLIEETSSTLSSETVQYLGLALSSGRRLGYLINDILDYSKLKNEELFLYRKPIRLEPIIQVVMTFSQSLIGEKSLRLIQDIPQDLPNVMADEDRLEQIMFNLVGNAVKYTSDGEVRVSARQEEGRVFIDIADTGPGIAKKDLECIFESFKRGEMAQAYHANGSGLGLSITQKLVELHGGSLTVTSELGKGSVFTFSLESVKGEKRSQVVEGIKGKPRVMDVPDAIPEVAGEQEKFEHRILIVDDDPVNVQVLRSQLNMYQVTVAENGAKALAIIDTQPPFDLAILDIMMPVISGYKLCRILRQRYRPVELPILLLTARNQVSDLVEGLESGASDFLTKPVSRRELQARVRTHLELVDIQRQLQTAQEQALIHAREAGKAEFATTVLHNVGNILNSINISCAGIADRISNSRLSGLIKANALLSDHSEDLVKFLSSDNRGTRLPEYYSKLGEILLKEQKDLRVEVDQVQRRIELMREIIETQQFFSKPEMVALSVDLGSLTDESLAVQADLISRYDIKVRKSYNLEDHVRVHQPLLVHVLVNLIKNAIEAMQVAPLRELFLETGRLADGRPFCRITDSGEGMDDVSRIFQSGYTTKKNGHGYGLYFCHKAMEAMGGALTAESEGFQKGSSFSVIFPMSYTQAPE